MKKRVSIFILGLLTVIVSGATELTGEQKLWHHTTLTFDGLESSETAAINPFMSYRLNVTFTHPESGAVYLVPGYFAADGVAGESSAEAGNKWRVHFTPDQTGEWTWQASFKKGPLVAVNLDPEAGRPAEFMDGETGAFTIEASDKQKPDFRAQGRLQYVGKHYLQFAGSKAYFLKMGADSPETFLACVDIDGTEMGKKQKALKTWKPHLSDWKKGDPTWQGGKGKGPIGAINYLAEKGANSISFLTYNAGGDGDNVWPFRAREDKYHYDCSKLDQWQVLFNHAQQNGLYLHFKMQEHENDDHANKEKNIEAIAESLDFGELGPERKLYIRELVARFGHNLALNWNLGEENTQTPEQQRAMATYIKDVDPYNHHRVIHSFPGWRDRVYPPLLGDKSDLTGASLQIIRNDVHRQTLRWVEESVKAGQPWVVANDEQGPANLGAVPDTGYPGFDEKEAGYSMHDVRKMVLWGTLMAGGAGVEYYFGYKAPENDLLCEDYRSRDKTWEYGKIAIDFFFDHDIPITEMVNMNPLVENGKNKNKRYCFAQPNKLYLVYFSNGEHVPLDLSGVTGTFDVKWFNPRTGGALQSGSVESIEAGDPASLGTPPADPQEDWLAIVRLK